MTYQRRRLYRSPTIILLFLFVLLTFASARHRIRHHRDRFKRQQGANLFLAGSYVYDEGEGPDGGPWGDWSSPSPCSRSCGGGVSTQTRLCQTGYTCQGPSIRHFSCNTQDCPDMGDFRAQQCSEFDTVPYEGVYYQWVPYTKAPNRCELNCMPKGGRFYYRYRAQVVDGTQCSDESFDVCVQGKCQPVGCDRMLGSSAREDRCRICDGDGSTCNTVTGLLDMQDLQVGYNDILLIPSGATNIRVNEMAPSNNYLAVRNTSGHYYLNGNWRIDFPRTLEFAGCRFHYERYPQGFAAPDKLSCLGPIEEPLFIVLLYSDRNVGVDYEYSLPTNIQPGSENETYAWTFDQFSSCSQTCGGGTQQRNVTCAGRKTLEAVDQKLCDAHSEPPSTQKCAEIPCEAQWAPYPWGNCSKPCGDGGQQSREIVCQQIVSNGYPSIVADAECEKLKPKPPTQQECNKGRTCAQWHLGPWKPCDHLCGDGKQTRQVRCHRNEGKDIELFEDAECEHSEPKPEVEKECNVRPCEGVDWITSEWSGCDKCGLTNETRKVQCATSSGEVFAESLCDQEDKPEAVRQCKAANQSCEYLWYASQWSECSTQCGEGVQTRTLFCGIVSEDGSVKKVEDAKCTKGNSYETIRNCTGELETCPGEWFSGPWTACSKPCGGGERSKKVVCLKDLQVVDPSECGSDKIIFGKEECNTQACSEDTIIPTDVTKPIDESESGATEESVTSIAVTEQGVDEEYEIVPDDECEDGEWVDDEPYADEPETEETVVLGSSTESGTTIASAETELSSDDLMLSDAPSSPEGSLGTTLEGSGETEIGSTGATESTFEGSGTGSDTTEEKLTTQAITESTESTTSSSETSDSSESSTTSPEQTSLASSSSDSTTVEFTSASTDTSESTTNSASSEESTSVSTDQSTPTETTEFSTTPSGSTSESSTDISSSTSEVPITSTSSSEESTVSGTTEEFDNSTMPFIGEPDLPEHSEAPEVSASTETSGSSTITSESESTVASELTTIATGSTEYESSSSSASTVESTGTTEISASTESSEPSASTEFDIWSSSTQSSSTEETTIDEWGTTPVMEIFETRKSRMCKRRKEKSCKTTKWGCCWDKISPAEGPFDKGCPTPHTCKESKHGCCEDGVSPALGRKFKGCPSTHCNETLFGCCADNKTAAQGNNKEGCPPPPPACLKTKFGCCKDNVTAAKGAKGKGCQEDQAKITTTTPAPKENCVNSTYGCCPDGAKSAEGPNYKGCKLPCSDSAYGCCPDGETPAHGYNREGCCLSGPHGCCPDNITPARGPNLEGCGCQYSPYRCCPDNVTAARGYNNEGCGCQFTEHGCCPDDYTPAAGPDYQGCLCHTFQFGCCPDGVSFAKASHQQGCGCRNTEFGCCSDESTPAKGANGTGCGCDSSKYGCCPDGVSEAAGDNFEGCEDIPVDLQESCTEVKERGPCRNYTVKWFFDRDYGGCSRFWYGGCDGNDNRFRSKEECDGVCVQPQGTDRCKLPKIPGPCEGYYPQWYYDKERKHCAQFVYGGCLGNNNRFETRAECMELCVKDDSIDACEQTKDEGPCRGNYRRWYYDKSTSSCQQFNYGGCKSNNNNFPTEEACKQQCAQPGRKKDHCSLPRAKGNCTAREPRWYYDIPEKRCLPFYYSGCNGNNNNFISREACEADCPKEIEKDLCQLPSEIGSCGNYTERWYYDTREKSCKQFYYGGCGGNGNNFETQPQCDQRCSKQQTEAEPEPDQQVPQPQDPFTSEMCFQPPESGDCLASFVSYYYDRSDGVCKSFTYGGCGGNRNNFQSAEECLRYCGNAQDLCSLPPVVGPCNAEYEQYYYDSRTDTCQAFTFGGCDGNYNRFPDRASCEQRCRRSSPAQEEPQQTQAPPESIPQDIAMCYEPANPGNCTDNLSVFFFDPATRGCTPFTYTGCGGNANRFNSEEQCERQCGSFRGQDVCNMDRDPGPCRGYFVKYYYDKNQGACGRFAYGGCGGNGNRFSSVEECEQICVTREEKKSPVTSTAVCQLPVEAGTCEDAQSLTRWYFDSGRGECIAFLFSGCGGNFNNFKTYQSCIDFCKDYFTGTEPPAGPEDHPCQAHFDECTTLRCPYGIQAYVDENQCNRCECLNPCASIDCVEGTQCAIDFNRNKTTSQDPDFVAICRPIHKEGTCPSLQPQETNCEQECRSDADCPLQLKCCTAGCSTACVEPIVVPAELVTQTYQPAYTDSPVLSEYVPPRIDTTVYEPEVKALIGDHVVLKCAVTGNPTPIITWKKGDLLIDGTQAKYRIKLDQSLQIITLHKTDAGVYLCTADNSVGEPITNRIQLEVLDSEPRSASILDPEDQPNVVVSLNAPATLNCLALGYPFPAVTWWKDDSMIPLKTNQFEVRKDYSLLINSVKLSNLGIYTCQAYNGVGKATSWSVTVKAKGPYHNINPKDEKYLKFIVNPPELPVTYAPPPVIPPQDLYPNEIDPYAGVNESQPANYVVPVRTNITLKNTRFPTNSEIVIPCAVEGYPTPQVQWYKDGVPITQSARLRTESNRLAILQATKSDSGTYQCEASNAYSNSASSVSVLIDEMFIHPNCKDNRFFANCNLIVKGRFCSHKFYGKFCCKSCTEAGLLPVEGPHLYSGDKQSALSSNLV